MRPQWHPQQKDDKRLGDKGATEPQLPHQGPKWTAEDHLTRNKKETAHPKKSNTISVCEAVYFL